MRTIKTRLLLAVHDAFDDAWDLLKLFGRGLVGHTEAEGDATLTHLLVIAQARFGQVAVGEHQYLTAEAANACGFETDVLDRSVEIINGDKIAHLKGFVQNNTETGKQITQDVLQCEANGNAANTQPGDQGLDVKTQIVKHDQRQKRPHHHPRDEAQNGQRAGGGRIFLKRILAHVDDPSGDEGAGAQGQLQKESHQRKAVDVAFPAFLHHQLVSGEMQSDQSHQEPANRPKALHQRVVPANCGGLGPVGDPADDDRQNDLHQRHDPQDPQRSTCPRKHVVACIRHIENFLHC